MVEKRINKNYYICIMRAKKINEQVGNIQSQIIQILKDEFNCLDKDIRVEGDHLTYHDMDFGPEETTLVMEIDITENPLRISAGWRAEDTGHEDHIDYAFGDKISTSLIEFRSWLEGLYAEVSDEYSKWQGSE